MCLWYTFLTVHEVTNKITFSEIHDRPLPGRLSTELASRVTLAYSEDFAHSNSLPGNSFTTFCEVYPSTRASEAGVCRRSDTTNYLCGGDIDMYTPLEKPNT